MGRAQHGPQIAHVGAHEEQRSDENRDGRGARLVPDDSFSGGVVGVGGGLCLVLRIFQNPYRRRSSLLC